MPKRWWLILLVIIVATPFGWAAEDVNLSLTVGDCKVLQLKDLIRVATSNPEVAEVVVTGGREVLINAKKTGLSIVNVWSKEKLTSYRVVVQEDYSNIQRELMQLINLPEVRVTVNAKYVILNGQVENSIQDEKAVTYAKMYREHVQNYLQVKKKYQILLTILVTEMKKEVQEKYGIRWGTWIQTTADLIFKDWSWGLIQNATGDGLRPLTDNWWIGTMLDEMEKNGDAKLLAAPSLLMTSNQEASFMAGGEIPLPISDGQGGIKIEWKEYGIKLKATAILNHDLSIGLNLAPEVSSLDWANAISVAGDRLPALAMRKTSTNLQMKAGSTLIISGLLKREDSLSAFKLPILGDLPIIGGLFRSREFQKGTTELLFFVTPQIIEEEQQIVPESLINPEFKGPFFPPTMKSETTNHDAPQP